jgi:ribose 5-phosphate isomerase B
MKIAMGAVAKGFALKEAVKAHLEKQDHVILDLGCHDADKFYKYPSAGQRVAEALQSGKAELGINICGSGTGATIMANKFKGVCAASCESVKTAHLLRAVNGGNCLCMGELIVSPELGCEMADAFVNAAFQGVDGIPDNVLAFWEEARDEMMSLGENATLREIETL